jgi:hypothetical protein
MVLVWSDEWGAEGESEAFDYYSKDTLQLACVPVRATN